MKLAVLFPGVGYHVDKPLLYYAKDLAVMCGYETIDVKYGELPAGIKGSEEKMREAFERSLQNALNALKEVKWDQYGEIIFISKSIGTAVAAKVAECLGIRTRNIYYTPVAETFQFPLQQGIAFHGTADTWVDTQVLKDACNKCGLQLFITEGANHSMETEDTLANIQILLGIMEKTAAYLHGEMQDWKTGGMI